MIIVAKFASVCPCCSGRVAVGSKVEWSRGTAAKHVQCATSPTSAAGAPARRRAYDSQKFNGYGRVRACKTGGNCSSFGDGRSCGGHDCDGY